MLKVHLVCTFNIRDKQDDDVGSSTCQPQAVCLVVVAKHWAIFGMFFVECQK